LHEHEIGYIPVIEDCSHCHGYKPIAKTAIFSLFPTKILGAVGEAGIIVTNSKDIYEKCKDLRSHGINGTNGRMDEIQAAALLAKLPYLDKWIARRKEIVEMYDAGLNRKTPGEFHYAYCIPGSEEKRKKLLKNGIESAFYYAWDNMALPLHPYLSNKEVETVIKIVKKI
jgi:dTDP-4-amino-4,6-dideoxygalactose transaminase